MEIGIDGNLNCRVEEKTCVLLSLFPLSISSNLKMKASSTPFDGKAFSSGQKNMQETIDKRFTACAAST
jgi:hypothetical protein